MKLFIFSVAAAVSLVAFAAKLDGIAARVDSSVITVGDVMEEIRRNPDIGKRVASGNEDEMKDLFKAALDNLIERRLILKAAAGKQVEIPEWVIDNQLREIVNRSFGGDMNKLQEEMTRSKVAMSEYRNTLKEDILVRGMRQQMIEQFITASPAAMKKEYADHPEKYRQEAKVTVRVILLKPGEAGDGVPSLETRWAQIGEELAKGEKFSDMAIKYSADSHAKDGGLWKDVNPAESFRPEIAEAIANLKVGWVSKMINLDGWGFVVKKESEVQAKQMTFAEAYDLIETAVKDAAAKKAYDEWIARLKDTAFIKVYPFDGNE
jgi:peptidyl-prolyl cis-trans isomerase SurA